MNEKMLRAVTVPQSLVFPFTSSQLPRNASFLSQRHRARLSSTISIREGIPIKNDRLRNCQEGNHYYCKDKQVQCGMAVVEEVPLTKSGDCKERADRRFGRDHLVTTRASSICTEGGGWKWLVGPTRRWIGCGGAVFLQGGGREGREGLGRDVGGEIIVDPLQEVVCVALVGWE
ncbi:hypothetical protein E2C01_016280 [Portunus trituberculatus]|uniref:Uncharacterized protein n=1 Tax=Portunus trituberculatus TaxID=210409 RepID=A0A5B7DNZ6_PORTR|nr:hypothetical protein [Portunus trituberculatus]